jgi:integrase
MKLDASSIAKLIAAAKLPEAASDKIFFDDELPGFGVRVMAGGGASYVCQYRNSAAKSRRVRLAAVAQLSVADARKAARQVLAKVALGTDVQSEKQAARQKPDAITFADMVAHHLKVQAKTLRPNSFEAAERYLTKPEYFGSLFKRAAASVELADAARCLREIVEQQGPSSAARARAVGSRLYSWGMAEGLLGGNPRNPFAGTNRPKEQARDRVLDDGELRAIWQACPDNDFGRAVRLLMLTGARLREIGDMSWQEIDFAKGTLTLPKERTKNGREHTIALSALAISLLKATPRMLGRDQVFGFIHWARCKATLAEQAGVSDWVLHDLRRSCATGMADCGTLPHIIEAALNHVSGSKGGIAGVYNRALYAAETAEAFGLWSKHVELISTGKRGLRKVRQEAAAVA